MNLTEMQKLEIAKIIAGGTRDYKDGAIDMLYYFNVPDDVQNVIRKMAKEIEKTYSMVTH